MLRKLSGRNALRQMRDYVVYLVTLVLSVTLMYSFHLLVFSAEIKAVMKSWSIMPFIVVFISLIIVLILGRLVSYITEFIFRRRSREFGTYMMLGIENREIAAMFARESRMLGAAAWIAGLVGGTYFYQILKAMVMHLFLRPFHISVGFSWEAFCLTGVYLFLIFGLSGRKLKKKIIRLSIRELLSMETENEKALVQKKKGKRVLFAMSVLALLLGCITFAVLLLGEVSDNAGGALSLFGLAMIVLSIFGLFMSVPAVLEQKLRKVKWKYKGRNLVLGRLFSGKICNLSLTFASVSILFLLVFLAVGLGLFFNKRVDSRVDETAFDFAVGTLYGQESLERFEEYIERELPQARTARYKVYTSGKMDFRQHFSVEDIGKFMSISHMDAMDNDCYMAMSVYEELRELLGMEKADLEEDKYYMHCSEFARDDLVRYAKSRDLTEMGGKKETLSFGGSFTGAFFQQEFFGNGSYYLLIVPDRVAEHMQVMEDLYVGVAKKELSMETYEGIASIERGEKTYITGKAEIRESGASIVMCLTFPLFYLAFILLAAVATIMTVQILSNLDQERRQFGILGECGMDRAEQIKILRRYFAVYYTFPVFPAAVGSTAAYLAITASVDWDVYQGMTLVGFGEGMGILGMTAGAFFSIYLIYCFSAYLSFKKAVL